VDKYRLRFYCFILILLFLLSTSALGQAVPPQIFNGLSWRLIGPFRGGRL